MNKEKYPATVRINAMLVKEIDYVIDANYYWTDSMSVLRYIANEKCRFHTFVANRIEVIREASKQEQWRYVNTRCNPADHASRGLSMTSLLQTEQWFHGPDFLLKTMDDCPQTIDTTDTNLDEDPEVKQVHSSICSAYKPLNQLLEHFSDWMKLKKITAWLLVAKRNLQTSVRRHRKFEENQEHLTSREKRLEIEGKLKKDAYKKCLSVAELKDAEIALIRHVQGEHFSHELEALTSERDKKRIAKTSSLLKLDPFLSNGILRVGGRLDRSTIPFEAKHPIILPKDSPVSKMILEDAHKLVGHLGKNAILANVRQAYWIIGANALIKRMLKKCVTCRRYQGVSSTEKMASLPAERVIANEPPFSRVGVDYFCPFEIKRGRSIVKRWGVIFTCMTIRGVHLEVAASMDTDSCICAIRRFIARRGPVHFMRSDNGTNCIGAERELREEISKLLKHDITSAFNPPTASNLYAK